MAKHRILAFCLAVLLLMGAVPALAADQTDGAGPAQETAQTETSPAAEQEAAETEDAEEAGDSSEEEDGQPAGDPDLAPGLWFHDALVQLEALGVDCTCEDGLVHAAAPMGRYDFIRLMNQALKLPVDESDPDAVRANNIQTALEAKLITADFASEAAMAAPFLRFHMVDSLYRAMLYVREEEIITSPAIDAYITDLDTIPVFCRTGVNAACVMGLVRGSGNKLNGWATLTRAEGLVAVLRLVSPKNRFYTAELPAKDEDLNVASGRMLLLINQAAGSNFSTTDFQALTDASAASIKQKGYFPENEIPYRAVGHAVTRYELAVLFDQILTARGEARKSHDMIRVYLSDWQSIPEPYQAPVANCILSGVMLPTGDTGSFNGADKLTYRQFHTYLVRLFRPETREAPSFDGEFTKVIGSYTTSFKGVLANSKYNACLASTFLNGVVIPAGGYLDFNNTAGDFNLERGFKLSSVFTPRGYEMGEGGGVCQTSSTFYAAAVYSNMKIHTRLNHVHKSTYIAAGLDATVSYPRITLLISNPYNQPVKVVSKYDKNSLSFYFLGQESLKVPDIQVEITAKNKREYVLTRTVDGVVNYTSESKYAS